MRDSIQSGLARNREFRPFFKAAAGGEREMAIEGDQVLQLDDKFFRNCCECLACPFADRVLRQRLGNGTYRLPPKIGCDRADMRPKSQRCAIAWSGMKCMVWYSIAWCGVIWCGVVGCGVVRYGVVWCGVVWCGVVWCGVVWCGVVWYSIA